jgi:hypothetical protein
MNAADLHKVLTALEGYHAKRWEEARKAFGESVTDAAEAYVKQLSFDAETQLKDAFGAYRKALISAAKPVPCESEIIPDRRFVPLPAKDSLPAEDRLPDHNDEEEAMNSLGNQERLDLLVTLWDPDMRVALPAREIMTRRILRKDTYKNIAETMRPQVGGPSQVRKIVRREMQKIAQRFSKVSKDLE